MEGDRVMGKSVAAAGAGGGKRFSGPRVHSHSPADFCQNLSFTCIPHYRLASNLSIWLKLKHKTVSAIEYIFADLI